MKAEAYTNVYCNHLGGLPMGLDPQSTASLLQGFLTTLQTVLFRRWGMCELEEKLLFRLGKFLVQAPST